MTRYDVCTSGSLAGSPLLSRATRVGVALAAATLFAALWLSVFPGKAAGPQTRPAATAQHRVIHVTLPSVEIVGQRDPAAASSAFSRTDEAPLRTGQAGPDAADPSATRVNLR